jgi:hypothetical protein
MKKNKSMMCRMFIMLLILFLSSCKLPFIQEVPPAGEDPVQVSYAGKERLKFSALRATNSQSYSIDGVLLAENEACIVYGDYNAGVTLSTAEEIAREYAERIGPNITGAFGEYYHPKNKKLIILLLDIIDGYNFKRNTTYVAGYFSMKDIFPKSLVSNSNEAPMLYIDINPGKPGDVNFYPTIAHELQHLINFSSRYRGKEPEVENMGTSDLYALIESVQQDEWVDEGLSSAAEYIYNKAINGNKNGYGHIRDKVDYYNKAEQLYKTGQSRIAGGNNFFTWGENDSHIYDDYVTVYLFFQWLRIQADNDTSIYRSIIESEYGDDRAVTAAAREHIPGLFEGIDSTDDQTEELERLLERWLAANYINAPKKENAGGIFGYDGEITLTPVMLSGKPVLLYPGEGVYSKLDGKTFDYPMNSPAHIRYAGLNRTEETLLRITQGNSGTGDALLTFNANHDVTMTAAGTPTEWGTLASTEPASAEPSPSGRAADMPAKPFPIDIRPPLRF